MSTLGVIVAQTAVTRLVSVQFRQSGLLLGIHFLTNVIINEIDLEGGGYHVPQESLNIATFMDFLQNLEGGELVGFKHKGSEEVVVVKVFTTNIKELDRVIDLANHTILRETILCSNKVTAV